MNRRKVGELVAGFAAVVALLPGCMTFSPFQHHQLRRRNASSSSSSTSRLKNNAVVSHRDDELHKLESQPRSKQLIIHWKGEAVDGYSLQFRHDEFRGALAAVTKGKSDPDAGGESSIFFCNALEYAGNADMSKAKKDDYNQAMQFLNFRDDAIVSTSDCIEAVQRCSLIHSLYEIVAETDSENYDDLAVQAMQNGGFDDMTNGSATWCVRVRHYGENEATNKERRYGHRARSMALERQALLALKPLLLTFSGNVDLKHPDCKIYVFDGLERSNKVLARRIASGPRVSILDPNTRQCITNTPLGSVAAFTMNNVARVQSNTRILDPFAGSCAILLAAAFIDPTVQTVGIELAHNGLVDRDDVVTDFQIRNLKPPAALIHGDCRDARIRRRAVEAVGGESFDCIVTDPPYGIRESTGDIEIRPIDELLQMIAHDRDHTEIRLLKKGGRLVVFLPQPEEESLEKDVLPTSDQLEAAGLRCELMREQPLNDKLSRWLVSYECIR